MRIKEQETRLTLQEHDNDDDYDDDDLWADSGVYVKYSLLEVTPFILVQGADNSLARPGRKHTTFPVFYGT